MAHVFEFEITLEPTPDGHRYDVVLVSEDIIAVAHAKDDLDVDRVAARLAYNVLRRKGLAAHAPSKGRLRLTLEYPDDEEYKVIEARQEARAAAFREQHAAQVQAARDR